MGELAVRLYLVKFPPRLRNDPVLGWRCVENYRGSSVRADAGGRRHRVLYSTDERGLRNSGDLHSGRPRVLVLGDSYTQAVAVSDEETYAARLGRMLGCEVFAYGAGGYGTLQEELVLEQLFDRVKPRVVVWQFCINDFINNDLALERASRIDNNGMLRPYLADDGRVVLALPKPFPWIRELSDSSKLLYALLHCWDQLGARFGDTVENEIARQGRSHPGFRHSSEITRLIFRRVAARVGDVPLLVFSADGPEPYYTEVQTIARELDLWFVRGVPEAIRRAERERGVARDSDGVHWNELGHELCARVLARHVQEALESSGEAKVGSRLLPHHAE
jgi:hypothetical protein